MRGLCDEKVTQPPPDCDGGNDDGHCELAVASRLQADETPEASYNFTADTTLTAASIDPVSHAARPNKA